MRVRMKQGIGGYRNGEPWPPIGGTIDVPAHEANDLIVAGYAAALTEAEELAELDVRVTVDGVDMGAPTLERTEEGTDEEPATEHEPSEPADASAGTGEDGGPEATGDEDQATALTSTSDHPTVPTRPRRSKS